MKSEIEKLVQGMVRINSTAGKTITVANYYKEFLEDRGISAQIDEYSPGKANLEARIGPKDAPKIIISGHMDVVPIGDRSKWQFEPFSGEIKDGFLLGRGSVDMKGGTACLGGVMLELLKGESELNYQIILAATAEEETGLIGARRFESQGIMENAELLLIAEPTGLGIGIMEKGVIWADIIAHGKQAHGSRPELGTNAIEGILKIIPEIHNILPDTFLPQVGKSTVNPGVITGGTVANVVPDYAKLICDFRLTPGVENEAVLQDLKDLLDEKSSKDMKYELHVDQVLNAPAVVSSNNDFAKIIASNTEKLTGTKPELDGMYYATDAAAFMENVQIPFAIFGPGSTEMLHQTNEKLSLWELDLSRKIILDSLLEING